MLLRAGATWLSRTNPLTHYFFCIPQSYDPVTPRPRSPRRVTSTVPVIYNSCSTSPHAVEPKLYHRLPAVLQDMTCSNFSWTILSKRERRNVAPLLHRIHTIVHTIVHENINNRTEHRVSICQFTDHFCCDVEHF